MGTSAPILAQVGEERAADPDTAHVRPLSGRAGHGGRDVG